MNVEGTLALAEKLVRQGTHVVFPSTNLVLDGLRPTSRPTRPTPRKPSTGGKRPRPNSVCGNCRALAWCGSPRSWDAATPLLLGWIAALRKGEAIRPFSDMPLAPVPLDFAVEALVAVAAARAEGVVQVSAEEDITYAEAARFVADCLMAARAGTRPAGDRGRVGHGDRVRPRPYHAGHHAIATRIRPCAPSALGGDNPGNEPCDRHVASQIA